MRELCIQADDQGELDMLSGTAALAGNVRGYMRSRNLAFTSKTLLAHRQGAKRAWRRIELNGGVTVSEPGRRIVADHAVLETATATLYGKVRLDEEGRWLEGDEVIVEHDAERVTAKGTPTKPLQLFVADTSPAPATAASTPRANDGTQLRAQRAVMEDDGRQLQLTGAVHVEMPARGIVIEAESVALQFNDDQSLQGFQARGNVLVVQPGRRLTADSARSAGRLSTILLQGKARMQQDGQFDLTSERLEVFMDAKRGVVRSEDRQRPMTLNLDLSAAKPYRLDAPGMARLKDQGVPEETLKKLETLKGRTFPTQAAFRSAAAEKLSAEEAEAYLTAIADQAKP